MRPGPKFIICSGIYRILEAVFSVNLKLRSSLSVAEPNIKCIKSDSTISFGFLLNKEHFKKSNYVTYYFCGNLKEILRGSLVQQIKLRTVSFHVPLFYDPMYNHSIFYHLSILQSISQSFHKLLLFTISSNHLLHLQNRFYLSTLFGSTHPIACI